MWNKMLQNIADYFRYIIPKCRNNFSSIKTCAFFCENFFISEMKIKLTTIDILNNETKSIVGAKWVSQRLEQFNNQTKWNIKKWIKHTIKNGWFVFLKTRFSAIVCSTSLFWITNSFLKILIANNLAVDFSRHKMTFP